MNAPSVQEALAQKVRFVTFNYDRSLERFLAHAWRVKFNPDQYVDPTALRRMFIHLHGQLGFLPEVGGEGAVVGTAAAVLLSDLDRYPSTCGVFQFDSHVLNRASEQFSGRRKAHVITHGALLPLRYVREQLRHMNAAADGFREQTGLNVHSGDTVAAMLLSWALHQNPGGIVLFASNRREHISRNVAISADRRLSREITSRFAEFFPRTPAGHA